MISSSSTSALQIYHQEIFSSSNRVELASSDHQTSHTSSLLYNLSVLKAKVDQVHSLVSILVFPDGNHLQHQLKMVTESTSIAIATMGTLLQEIIATASSIMFTCQQMGPSAISAGNNNNTTSNDHGQLINHQVSNKAPDDHEGGLSSQISDHFHLGKSNKRVQGYYSNDHHADHLQWYSGNNLCLADEVKRYLKEEENNYEQSTNKCYDIIELDAADLLAKYTHYCQVCGKGFKRDANLRMHMRAHGDEYKTTAALTNPMKHINDVNAVKKISMPRKYSCPQQGCRWNQKHVKFQPLKSIICVKNHYKRSHCPKMYVCKRCNRKQFSVLSDLRTHEKHCGDLKWQCSCGTTFSRKDKLMGHVALFLGHEPANISALAKTGKVEQQATQMELHQS